MNRGRAEAVSGAWLEAHLFGTFVLKLLNCASVGGRTGGPWVLGAVLGLSGLWVWSSTCPDSDTLERPAFRYKDRLEGSFSESLIRREVNGKGMEIILRGRAERCRSSSQHGQQQEGPDPSLSTPVRPAVPCPWR